MKKNSIPSSVLNILLAIFCLSRLHCAPDIAGGGSEVETKVGLYGKLVLEDGTPVEGATVKAYLIDSALSINCNYSYVELTLDSVPVDTVFTDSSGIYLFDSLDDGTYDIEGIFINNSDTLYAVHPNIIHDSLTDAGTDTLRIPGCIKGQVDLDQSDKMGVSVYIPGTSYLALTDKDGSFLISSISPDSSYIVAYSFPGYLTALDSNITVISGDTTDLGIKKLLIDPDSPIPPPVDLTAAYDSIQGVVTITWNAVKHPNLAGYLVYRKDSSLTSEEPELISGSDLVTDSLFFDSIFIEFQDSIPRVYQYQVKSQDKKNNQSLFSWPVYVKVFPPDLPGNPVPADGDTGIAPSLTLSWSPVKGNGTDTVKYTVFFDAINPSDNILSQDLADTSTEVSGLDLETNYYWFVSASYGAVTVRGPVWHFRTCKFGKIKWEFETNGNIWSGPAIGSDGTLYIGSEDYNVYAINPDGSKKWEFETGGIIRSSPVIDPDGTIYVGSEEGKVYAINPDGSTKWEVKIGGVIWLSTPAIGTDGTLYIGTDDFYLYAINPDGSKKWEFETKGKIRTSPVIGADGTIYVNSYNLYAINPDGSSKWEFRTDGSSNSCPAIGADGAIYFGAGSTLHAINPDKTKKWEFQLESGGFGFASPVIGTDGTIYIGSSNGNLNAINADGSKKWEYNAKSDLQTTPAIHSDGTIFISSYSGRFYAINPDGSEKWEFDTDYLIRDSHPAIHPDGIIYFDSDFGLSLYAIIINCGGLADSPWPMFMHDVRHTGRQ